MRVEILQRRESGHGGQSRSHGEAGGSLPRIAHDDFSLGVPLLDPAPSKVGQRTAVASEDGCIHIGITFTCSQGHRYPSQEDLNEE